MYVQIIKSYKMRVFYDQYDLINVIGWAKPIE